MISIQKIDTTNRRDARRFVQFPNQLYRGCPQWVPYPIGDGLAQLNRRNAYFMHSHADFFVAEKDGRIVGRICVMENRHYNEFRQAHHAFFYLFDTIEDVEVARGLGGNAVLYTELEKTVRQGNFEHGDLTQMADSVIPMLADAATLGARPYKVHRMYRLDI